MQRIISKRKTKRREGKEKRFFFTCAQRLDVNHVALVIGVILAGHLAELDVAEMEYSRQDTIHRVNLAVLESEQFKPGFQLLELVYMRLRRLTVVGQESMVLSKIQIQVEFREAAVRLQAIVHVIKYMKITLPSETGNRTQLKITHRYTDIYAFGEKGLLGLGDNSRLFQQIHVYPGACDLTALGHGQVQVFPKSGRVGVNSGGRVTKRLHYRIYLKDPLLQVPIRSFAEVDQLFQQQIRALGFPRPRLAADHDRLILPLMQQRLIRGVGHRENVRRIVGSRLTLVPLLLLCEFNPIQIFITFFSPAQL